MSMLQFFPHLTRLGMTREKRDSASPVGPYSVPVESECGCNVGGRGRDSVSGVFFASLS